MIFFRIDGKAGRAANFRQRLGIGAVLNLNNANNSSKSFSTFNRFPLLS